MRDLIHWIIDYPKVSKRHLGGEPPSKLVRFTPYLNTTVFRHLAFKFPGAPPPRFMVEMLPPGEERGWLCRYGQMPDMKVYASLLTTTILQRRWRRFRWNPLTNWQSWRRYLRRLDDALPGLSGELSDSHQAMQRIHQCYALARDYIEVHICSLLFANITYQVACSALIDAGFDAETYLTPSDGSMTVKTNEALWRVGRGDLSLEEFLKEFGHRAANSWELFCPRWREDVEMVRGLAAKISERDQPNWGVGVAKQQVLDAELRPHLRWLVQLTRRYLLLREEQRFHFDRLLWEWKRGYLWLEDDLGMAIRYLEHTELSDLVERRMLTVDAKDLIDERQADLEREVLRRSQGDVPPDFLGVSEYDDPLDESSRIQGLGISMGVVTGRVCVVRRLSDCHRLQSGDILVVPSMDPGWTSLLMTSGGLVTELGGVLCHGAVVAREYRVPAVVNVAKATTRLRDGQRVTIDGTRGIIWINSV